MFLGLRKVEGVPHHIFEYKFNHSIQEIFAKQLEQLKKEGLLEVDNNGVRLTRKGRFVGNEVFQQFLFED